MPNTHHAHLTLLKELEESFARLARIESGYARQAEGAPQPECEYDSRDEVDHVCFRALFDNHSAVMLLVEAHSGRIIAANRGAATFYGYSQETLRTMRVEQLNVYAPKDVHALRMGVLRGKQNHFLAPHRLADGRVRTVEVFSAPVALSERAILFSVVQDVTDREQARATLREAENALKDLCDRMPVGFFQSTPQGRFTSVNATMARIYGYASPEEMLSLVGCIPKQIYASPQDRVAMERLLEKHGAVSGHVLQHKTKTGQRIWVSITLRPVHDENGAVTSYEGFILDITQLKRTEAELRESESHRRGLFAQCPLPYLALDEAGRCTDMNAQACALLGFSRKELAGAGIESLLPAEERATGQASLAALIAAGTGEMGMNLKRRDASTLPARLNLWVQRDAKGHTLRVHCLIQDMREGEKAA